MTQESCLTIRRFLERRLVATVDVPEIAKNLGRDECLYDIWAGPKKIASLMFKRGLVESSDIPTDAKRGAKIRALLKNTAKSCRIEEVHEHANQIPPVPPEEREANEAQRYHFHMKGCTVADARKVLKKAGY